MRKLLFLIIAAASLSINASAQKLIIGERAPELRIGEWITDAPDDNKPKLIEFYHSSSKQSQDRIPKLNELAQKYSNSLSVIVITRESKDKIFPLGLNRDSQFKVAIDDNGKTFSNYGVQFVPFGVIIDAKGKLIWFGNPCSLSESDILSHIK